MVVVLEVCGFVTPFAVGHYYRMQLPGLQQQLYRSVHRGHAQPRLPTLGTPVDLLDRKWSPRGLDGAQNRFPLGRLSNTDLPTGHAASTPGCPSDNPLSAALDHAPLPIDNHSVLSAPAIGYATEGRPLPNRAFWRSAGRR